MKSVLELRASAYECAKAARESGEEAVTAAMTAAELQASYGNRKSAERLVELAKGHLEQYRAYIALEADTCAALVTARRS